MSDAMITERTGIRTDLKTLVAVLVFAIMAAGAYFSLKSDNARMSEQLIEARTAQRASEVRLVAIERWQIEMAVGLRMKGVMP